MKKVFALGILFAFLVSCKSDTTYQTVKIKNKYSLELPEFMSKGTTLHPDASLQYQNTLKELYVVVFDEKKTDFPNPEIMDLNEYTKLLRDKLKVGPGDPVLSAPRDTIINGLKSKLFSMSGKIQKLDIYYEMAYLESKAGLYQVITWTQQSRKDRFSAEMKKIIASFKEIESRKK